MEGACVGPCLHRDLLAWERRGESVPAGPEGEGVREKRQECVLWGSGGERAWVVGVWR